MRDSSITVAHDCVIDRLLAVDGAPHAELSDGRVVPADLVLAATGFRQVVPFLPEEVTDRLLDPNGDYLLYRQILPVGVPDLTFNGYNSSLFSPLSAEMSAVWIGSLLAQAHRVPSPEVQRQHVTERLAWMTDRTRGKHAHGTNVIPFSLHNIDEVQRPRPRCRTRSQGVAVAPAGVTVGLRRGHGPPRRQAGYQAEHCSASHARWPERAAHSLTFTGRKRLAGSGRVDASAGFITLAVPVGGHLGREIGVVAHHRELPRWRHALLGRWWPAPTVSESSR